VSDASQQDCGNARPSMVTLCDALDRDVGLALEHSRGTQQPGLLGRYRQRHELHHVPRRRYRTLLATLRSTCHRDGCSISMVLLRCCFREEMFHRALQVARNASKFTAGAQ
jgi:hypothetical protein